MRRASPHEEDGGEGRPPPASDERDCGGSQSMEGRRSRRRLHLAEVPRKLERQYDTPTAFRCLPCAALKIKCSRTVPCDRCFKLSLRCEPPEAYLLSAQAAATATGIASPMLELAFRTVEPAKLSQRFVGAFLGLLARGQIDRTATRTMLQTFRARSRLLGSDCSFGATDAMARALGLTSVDLEAPEEMAYEPPPPLLDEGGAAGGGGGGSGGARLSRLDAFRAASERLRAALEDSAAWRFLSGPGLPASASVYMTIPTGVHSVLVSKGPMVEASEVLRSVEARRMLTPLLVAGAVAPDDVEDWFELEFACNFSDSPQSCSRFIKVMDKGGNVNLYLITARRVFVEEIGMTCRVTLVETAPQSRHICPTPSHPHRVVNAYRHSPTPDAWLAGRDGSTRDEGTGRQEAPAWMGAHTPAGAGHSADSGTGGHSLPCLPGMAALPVPKPVHWTAQAPSSAPVPSPAPAPPPARVLRPPPASAPPAVPPCLPPTTRPVAGAGRVGGFEMLCHTIASEFGEGTAGVEGLAFVPPQEQAADEDDEEEEEEDDEAQALLRAALGVSGEEEEHAAVPVFEGEEMMEAALKQGGWETQQN